MSVAVSAKHIARSFTASSKPYVCRSCRESLKASIPTTSRRFASTEPQRDENQTTKEPSSALERIRSKLWKGKPPGPENIDDVYGGPGVLQTKLQERKKRRSRETEINVTPQPKSQLPLEAEAKPSPEAVNEVLLEKRAERAQLLEEDAALNERLKVRKKTILAPPSEWKGRTWHGLVVVGHEGDWREMEPKPADDYSPWLQPRTSQKWSYEDLVSLMHRAIVETALGGQRKGKSAGNHTNAKVVITEDGVPEIGDISEASKTPLEHSLLYNPRDNTFLSGKLNLANPKIFKILEYLALITGRHIPDPVINVLSESTIDEFLRAFAVHTSPKPAKLAYILLESEVLPEATNLKIASSRETPVHKEKEIGRWKLIEDELQARGLPVLGRAQIRQ